jgi:hypothetical protein
MRLFRQGLGTWVVGRQRRWLWAGVLTLMAIALVMFRTASLRGKASGHGTAQLGVVNKTQTLEVASIERTGKVYRVTLKNNSAKTVTDYAYNVGPAISDLASVPGHICASISIAPGATATDSVGGQPNGGSGGAVLNILAVYFIDGSGEGDGRVVQEFRDTEAGYELVIRLVKPMVHELAGGRAGEMLQGVGDLALRIRQLPEPPELAASAALRAGFLDRREMAANEVDELAVVYKSGGLSLLRGKLAEAEGRYEKQWQHLNSVRDALDRPVAER